MNDNNSVAAMTAPVPSLGSQIAYACRYYWPRLKWQVIWYAIASFVIAVLLAVTSHYNLQLLYLTLVLIVSLMMIFAPLSFARYNSRALDITLPISWVAKSIFVIGYTVIVIPLLSMLLPVLSMELLPGEVNIKFMMMSMKVFEEQDMPPILETLVSTRLNIYMNGVVPALFTLFFVILFRYNIVLKTIVWDVIIAAIVYIGLISYTVFVIFYKMTEQFADEDVDPAEAEAIADTVVHDMMMPIVVGSSIGWMVTAVVLIILTALKIKNRQI